MRLFEIDPDTNTVLLNKVWISLVPELKELLTRDKGSKGDYRGDKKLKATKEFTFIYFYTSFESPLRDWNKDEKWKESLRYADLADADIDEKVLIAQKAYERIMLKSSRSLRTYHSLNKALDALDDHFENLDFTQKDKKGELLNDPLSVAKSISELDKVYTAVKNFEKRVDEELKAENTGIRGTAEMGDMEASGNRTWSEGDVLANSDRMKSGSVSTFSDMLGALNQYKASEEEEEEDNE